MMGLTKKQACLLDYLEWRQSAGELAPTYEEMRAHMGAASKSTIARLVSALERRGYIVRNAPGARSIELVPRFQRDRDCSIGAIEAAIRAEIDRGGADPKRLAQAAFQAGFQAIGGAT